MDHFILDKGGQCNENEQDNIFQKMRLSMNLVNYKR
jgi:hypothetical protein